MILVALGGTARDSFLTVNNQGNPQDVDAASPEWPQVASVTLNNADASSVIVPTITQAQAPGLQTGQYEIEFTVDYTGAAPGDVIVVRVAAEIQNKVKERLLKFVVDPGQPAQPFIDVA